MTVTDTTSDKPKRRYMPPDVVKHDTVRRHLKRPLPVPLTRDEMTDIAIAASKKRQQVAQLERDAADEAKRRKQQIADIQRDIDTADRELATGNQERIVSCDELFLDGLVYTVRTDTWEAFEQRAANAQEAQRFLPAVESASHQPAAAGHAHTVAPAPSGEDAEADEPDDDVGGEVEDDGTRSGDELTAAQRSAAETKAAREERRAAKRDKNGA